MKEGIRPDTTTIEQGKSGIGSRRGKKQKQAKSLIFGFWIEIERQQCDYRSCIGMWGLSTIIYIQAAKWYKPYANSALHIGEHNL